LVVTNDTNNTQFNNGTFLSDDIIQSTKGTFLPVIIVAGFVIAGDTVAAAVIAGACAYVGVCIGEYIWNNRNYRPTYRSSSSKVNSVALGSGYGYSYSYSYSYRHGYGPRSYTQPVYTPYVPPVHPYSYYKIAADGSYALVTSTTTGNPDEIKNQKIKDIYNKKKALQLAKIAGIIGTYLENKVDQTYLRYNIKNGKIERGTVRVKYEVGSPDGGDLKRKILAAALVATLIVDRLSTNTQYTKYNNSTENDNSDYQKTLNISLKNTKSFTNKERLMQMLINGY